MIEFFPKDTKLTPEQVSKELQGVRDREAAVHRKGLNDLGDAIQKSRADIVAVEWKTYTELRGGRVLRELFETRKYLGRDLAGLNELPPLGSIDAEEKLCAELSAAVGGLNDSPLKRDTMNVLSKMQAKLQNVRKNS